jgi:hypothetical protein
MPYLEIVVMRVCAITFYRAGCHEHSWGILWAALSIFAGLLALLFLGWRVLGVLLSQIVLFFLITIYRMMMQR